MVTRLALQLWIGSILCWWVVGIRFSQLWWLVNDRQQDWIRFCYFWEVPVIGWTGAVLWPCLRLRRLIRRQQEGDVTAADALAGYPGRVAGMILATSSVGYLLGAMQVDWFAALPTLEFLKITIQGPVLGGLFGVAGYLLAERAVQRLELAAPALAPLAEAPAPRSLSGKIFFITVALTIGVAVPIFLYGLTQVQRQEEQLRARVLSEALSEVTGFDGIAAATAGLGAHSYGFVVRRSNNFIIHGRGAGSVLYGQGHTDFAPIQRQERGWFASRDGEHKVVAFEHRPAVLPDGDGAVLVLVSPIQDYATELIPAVRTFTVVALAALAIGLVLAAMLARSIVRPIERLRAAAMQIAGGDLQVPPLGRATGDEVAALGRAFDRMAARLRTDEANLRAAFVQLREAQDRMVQSERLSAVGRVASGVAHELNNPLSAVLHLAEDLGTDPSRSPADREALVTIADQARRCRGIVRDLLSFARGRERRPEPTQAAEVLAAAATTAAGALRESGCRLETAAPSDRPAMVVDRTALEQVLTNLIVNGAQAAGPGGTVRASASATDGGWRFTVEDTGPGIAADVLPRIFEPFFTTKPEGQGTGLGLAVSLGIVQRQGGTLEVSPGGDGRGATFVVTMPPARADAVPVAEPMAAIPVHSNGASAPGPGALVVDDERSVRLALARYLTRRGWEVVEAEDGEVALRMLAEAPVDGYGLIISDLRMPRRSGFEVHDWLAEHRPDLFRRLIVATGDIGSPRVQEFLARTGRPVLEKPFELSALEELVEKVRA